MSKADERHDISVEEYITSLDDTGLQRDARTIMDIMHDISGEEPILYGFGTIGYGVYKYEYSSGRKGEAHTLGFYPRKGKITVYLMDGTARYSDLLEKLGKHSITGYCVYFKRLDDIDLDVLRKIIQSSYDNISALSDGKVIDRILWQTEK